MKKLKLKKEIFDMVKSLIEKKQTDFEIEMNRLRKSSEHQESEQYELIQKSQDDATQEIVDKLSDQYNFAHQELLHLNILKGHGEILAQVQPGALVITNQGGFFISVATSDFDIKDMTIMGLSPDAPIYKVLYNKVKGDHFTFKGVNYTIEDLF